MFRLRKQSHKKCTTVLSGFLFQETLAPIRHKEKLNKRTLDGTDMLLVFASAGTSEVQDREEQARGRLSTLCPRLTVRSHEGRASCWSKVAQGLNAHPQNTWTETEGPHTQTRSAFQMEVTNPELGSSGKTPPPPILG